MGEPSTLDVTSRDDVLKALENGRMGKIAKEYIHCEKEADHN
jgi:hypothetical protein